LLGLGIAVPGRNPALAAAMMFLHTPRARPTAGTFPVTQIRGSVPQVWIAGRG
jgi:hypothetical protein